MEAKGDATGGVAEFFAGRNVFVTGATGFVGKVTVEKLLRSAPEVSGVFLLVRGKKGVEPLERIKSLFEEGVFDRLKEEQPDCLDKVRSSHAPLQPRSLPAILHPQSPARLPLFAICTIRWLQVHPIVGDMLKPDLGISAEDRAAVVDRCTVVIHIAATVNFNDPIKLAAKMNIVGVSSSSAAGVSQHCSIATACAARLPSHPP